ncbi:hypothetical protein B5K06_24615 [Rhizobium grahamii]|uniref:Uncharacterized protein n=1 Tax=Rhizobium grahamii TaxID=1120045 RepID=A0A370KIC8_9HYPH|nr:hypothetical protein B5K06_24615 [Rhizobium grahamii]
MAPCLLQAQQCPFCLARLVERQDRSKGQPVCQHATAVDYRNPKKLRIARIITTAPTSQIKLFMWNSSSVLLSIITAVAG